MAIEDEFLKRMPKNPDSGSETTIISNRREFNFKKRPKKEAVKCEQVQVNGDFKWGILQFDVDHGDIERVLDHPIQLSTCVAYRFPSKMAPKSPKIELYRAYTFFYWEDTPLTTVKCANCGENSEQRTLTSIGTSGGCGLCTISQVHKTTK